MHRSETFRIYTSDVTVITCASSIRLDIAAPHKPLSPSIALFYSITTNRHNVVPIARPNPLPDVPQRSILRHLPPLLQTHDGSRQQQSHPPSQDPINHRHLNILPFNLCHQFTFCDRPLHKHRTFAPTLLGLPSRKLVAGNLVLRSHWPGQSVCYIWKSDAERGYQYWSIRVDQAPGLCVIHLGLVREFDCYATGVEA